MNVPASINNFWQLLRKIPVTSSIGIAALVVALFPWLEELLQYDRAAISAGEVWRLITCYLVHWNADHLVWDWLMFVVLGGMCEVRNPWRMRSCLVAGVAAVSAVVYLGFPSILAYRGLSGLDSALFALLATDLFYEARREEEKLRIIATGGLLFAFVAKTTYEAITGQTLFVDRETAGFVTLVFDHLAGAVVGVAAAVVHSGMLSRKPISLYQ